MNAADELLGPALKRSQADEAAIIAGGRKVTYAELQAAAARSGGAFTASSASAGRTGCCCSPTTALSSSTSTWAP